MSQKEMTTDGEKIFGVNTEFHRFGLISATLLIVGVMGGMAVGLGAIENVLALIMIVIPTMLTLSLLLAVAPMKYILGAGIVSVIVDVLFITYFLLT
ncbi:MAG: hypothetical protein EP333_01785 [Bacteroidetes bacterium]|nr:MAG: hypothetical protein EP333_01785 [Bacteroidota bacterium]TNE96879.1 MAG: hypothetical protein EP322_07655 [Bacteroidota bacterium]